MGQTQTLTKSVFACDHKCNTFDREFTIDGFVKCIEDIIRSRGSDPDVKWSGHWVNQGWGY